MRRKAKGWSMAVELGKQSIETFSEVMYPYQWPVIRICDAFSGMGYPMLTNCGGEGPSPRFSYLLYHEIGHQWFMGQVGSNQADRPFLDEGFTTHIEHIAVEKYLGRGNNFNVYDNWYQKKFEPPIEDRDERGFRPLLLTMKKGYDKPMVFSYDQGEEYFPYRYSAYYKSAAMHYSLRSILGDSAYFKAMHHYCSQWFFKHPYEDDFVKSMEEATGLELDQYLDQWFYSRHRLDYAFDGKKSTLIGSTYNHKIKLKRPGLFVAPIDLAVIWETGDTSFYTVAPEGMRYQKLGYELLPDWEQFRRLNDKYECTFTSDKKIKKVVLDPYHLLIDIDRTNNQSGLWWPTEVRLDNLKYDRTPVWQYALRLRPDIWYDIPNGVQLGFHAHGSYLEIEKKFSLDARIGTKSERGLFDLEVSKPFEPFGNNSIVSNRILRADRRTFWSNVYEKKFKPLFARTDFDLIRLELNYLNLSGSQDDRFDPLPNDAVKYLPESTWDAAETEYAVVKLGRMRTFRYGS
ncbi:MAG TPA: M1 family aminopeptidase, partial [candidate division Zixibacteria bacterium]|nr:M1 family aminopeptidase [candidate division Zixibacteria bacterium]